MDAGALAGKSNYVIIYGGGCFNSKHQARRTVSLYHKYQGRVNFAVIDLDKRLTSAQQDLVTKYYKGLIPHVVILDARGHALYNQSGEVEESATSEILDRALR
jgi:thioredoxin-related protein